MELTRGDEYGLEGILNLAWQNQEGSALIREPATLEDILEVTS